jgi:RHS repeat-associated protein
MLANIPRTTISSDSSQTWLKQVKTQSLLHFREEPGMSQAKPDDPVNRSEPRVVLLATDRSQSIIGEIVDGQAHTIAYSAYGEQSAQQKVETRLGFNGQLREADIGWYLLGNGYRAYNPRLMRFHSPDSWSPFRGGGLNAYMYCMGDPVNRVDPTGHMSFWKFLGKSFDFFLGGPNVTGSQGLSIKQAKTVQRLGGLRPPEGDSMENLVTAGALVFKKPPKVNWVGKSPGGELHGTAKWGTDNFPNHASIGTASSDSERSIPMVGKNHTKPLSGRPTNSGGPPTYNQAMSGSMLSNKDTLAAGLNPQEYKVYHMQQQPPQYENLNIAAPHPAPVVQQVPVPQLPAAVINVRNAPVRGRQPLRRTNDVSRRP